MNELMIGAWAVEWDARGIALEQESGDLELVEPFQGGILIATIDGLGHGPEAALASRRIAEILRTRAGEPLDTLLSACHEGARSTRGAVMTVASFVASEAALRWCGIGNVEAVLFRRDPSSARRTEGLSSRAGVVGYRMPTVHATSVSVGSGDVLVMATDGLGNDFTSTVDVNVPPADCARTLLEKHARGTDDALALVVHFWKVGP